MTLDQLKTFLWVARLGGVRRAAEQMNVSQPAVSARIGALESDLGVSLFDRHSSGVVLTKPGVLLRAHAEQIAMCIERIHAEVVPPEGVDRLLRIGVSETIAQSWLPDLLSKLRGKYPNLSIEVSVDVSMRLREQLLNRSLDLAMLMGPVLDSSVDNIDLPTFEMRWFCPVELSHADLSSTPVISYSRNTRPFEEIKAELMKRYGGAAQIFPVNSLSTGFEMVAAGIGVACLPLRLGQRMLDSGRLRTFDPGWYPQALRFTASFIAEPHDELAARTAQLAREIAEQSFTANAAKSQPKP